MRSLFVDTAWVAADAARGTVGPAVRAARDRWLSRGENLITTNYVIDKTLTTIRFRLGLADVQPDFLGRAYGYLLRKFAEGSGQSAGEFFTPTEIGFLIAHLMRPRPGEACHDYACGSVGLLVKLHLVAREVDARLANMLVRLR